jgi:hypothetical protein
MFAMHGLRDIAILESKDIQGMAYFEIGLHAELTTKITLYMSTDTLAYQKMMAIRTILEQLELEPPTSPQYPGGSKDGSPAAQ